MQEVRSTMSSMIYLTSLQNIRMMAVAALADHSHRFKISHSIITISSSSSIQNTIPGTTALFDISFWCMRPSRSLTKERETIAYYIAWGFVFSAVQMTADFMVRNQPNIYDIYPCMYIQGEDTSCWIVTTMDWVSNPSIVLVYSLKIRPSPFHFYPLWILQFRLYDEHEPSFHSWDRGRYSPRWESATDGEGWRS